MTILTISILVSLWIGATIGYFAAAMCFIAAGR